MKKIIKILGHHNPYNLYPAIVVPVCLAEDGNKYLIYKDNFRLIDSDESFLYDKYENSIYGYEADAQVILAFSSDEIEVILAKNLAEDIKVYYDDGKFDLLDPYLSINFALMTQDKVIIKKVLRNCYLEAGRRANSFFYDWYESILKKIRECFSDEFCFMDELIPANPDKLIDKKNDFVLRVGAEKKLSLVLKNLSRIINNKDININGRSVYIEPFSGKMTDPISDSLYKSLDVILSEFLPYDEKYELKRFVSNLWGAELGETSFVVVIRKSESLFCDFKELSFIDILKEAEGDKKIKIYFPEYFKISKKIIERSIEFSGSHQVMACERCYSYSDLRKSIELILTGTSGVLVAKKYEMLTLMSRNSNYKDLHLIDIKSLSLGTKVKAFLLNSNVVFCKEAFDRVREYMRLGNVVEAMSRVGVVDEMGLVSENAYHNKISNIQFKIPLGKEVFEGECAVYVEVKELRNRDYARTVVANAVEVNQYPGSKIQKGDDVVVKRSRPLNEEVSKNKKNDYLDLINNSLRREYNLYKRILGKQNVALAFDDGVGYYEDYRCHFIVCDYVMGLRLKDWLSIQNKISAEDFLLWARMLASALKEIHEAGAIHGEINISSIIVRDKDKIPVFVDLGQGILRKEIPPKYYKTDDPQFVSPEKDYSVEGDIYSLCAVFYYMLTGLIPSFGGMNSLDIKKKVVKDLKRYNMSLYEENSGIADIIARGLRYKYERTRNTHVLLEDIGLFDHKNKYDREHISHLLRPIVTKVKKFHDPLFESIIKSKLAELQYYVNEMDTGVRDVWGGHEDLVIEMSRFMSNCAEGDMYLTISIPDLWFTDNMGINGRLLSINKHMIKSGVMLRRVFIVAYGEIIDENVLNVLRAHRDMMEEISKECENLNTVDWRLEKSGGYTGVLLVDDAERKNLLKENPHSGIWLRDNSECSMVKIIQPFYDDGGKQMTGVRIMNGNKNVSTTLSEYENNILSKSIEIREFFGVFEK
jgi:serine/threonine protein kinase